MQVRVGSVIKYKGDNCIVTEIRQQKSTYFAREDSTTLRGSQPHNVQYLKREIDDFQEGDIITREQESIELKAPGKALYFIYTIDKITKETNDGQQGTEGGASASSDDKTQSPGDGDQGGQSARQPSARQDGDPLHKDG